MRLHGVLKRALPGLAAAAVTLSVAAGPAAAQTSNTNPFQPKGSTTATTAATATPVAGSSGTPSAASTPTGIGSTSGSAATPSASTGASGTSAATASGTSAAMATTGVEAARFALIGLVCVALGLMLVLAARPRRRAVARSPWDLASLRTR